MKKIIVAVSIIMCLLLCGCGMNHLPKGELITTSASPDSTYRVNAYLCNGGATTDYAVRCEVETLETGKRRNIYWQYHAYDAVITWESDSVVVINDIKLDVTKDTYDYRDYN